MRIILLLEADSVAKLRTQEATVHRLLDLPGVASLSIRVPGRAFNPSPGVWDYSVFDYADAIALSHDAELQTRTMGGRWAPDHIIDDDRNHIMIWPGRTGINLPRGSEIPLCFSPDGSTNSFWYDWCIRAQKRLVRWALPKANVKVQHGFWSGMTWAELAVVNEMAAYDGFDYSVIEMFHVRMMQSLHELWPRDVEFALSGHVDKPYNQIFGKLLAIAKTSPRYIINRNDIGTAPIHEMNFGSIQDPPRHGFQMWGTQAGYDWRKVLDECDGLGESDGAVYLEVYPGNFGTATSPSTLVPEIARRYGDTEPEDVRMEAKPHVIVSELPKAEVLTVGSPGERWQLPARSVDAIKQLYTPSTAGLLNTFDLALKNTDNLITGFGTRIPAKWLDNDLSLLDQSKAIADAKGKLYRPRTMMGGHISDTAKVAMGSSFLFDGTGVMAGVKCPRATNGTSLNVVLLDYYRLHVRRVFEWCYNNGVDLFNVPTLGMAYAELFFGPEVQNDADAWLALHMAMVDIVAEEQRPGVTAGWGLSGHGPFFTTNRDHGDMGMQLAQAIDTVMPMPDQAEAQGNGLSPTQIWGQQSATVEAQMDRYLTTTGLVAGAQAIQPWGVANYPMLTGPEWAAVFAQVESIEARQVELYLDTPAKATDKRLVPHLEAYLAA